MDGAVAFTSSVLRPNPIEVVVSEVMAVRDDILHAFAVPLTAPGHVRPLRFN